MTRIQFRSSIHDGYALYDETDELSSPKSAICRALARRKRAHGCRLVYLGRTGRTYHYRATLTARGGAVLAETTVFTEF